MGNGVGFVKRAFEKRDKVIDELAARNEGFRDLCDDFEIANNEEERWRQSTAPERDERIAEYKELIEATRSMRAVNDFRSFA
ncbi:hypothetical protein [Rhizobium leguminosarum]|uniref:hypothetical protein n=1 Tax=Rhizobium leguminosarum TaxID=384 RepID=UPI00103CE66F|nr:hypothetical protein [Rhizobium leguminosarum]TBY16543.1 hypothetical protein E0H30_28940 [Rhizobium leguminosarum bv. viciae]TBY23354.1 hypothetical protein E0H37_26475 [Rhizobium leguminosarum bv. viciae]TBY98056.1 hypothetical protein E0H49_22560 [Rhizobium leguminosarum bv. viciae]